MNKKKNVYSKAWHLIYAVNPPFRKMYQVARRLNKRGPYLLGKINSSKYTVEDFKKHLLSIHFEKNRLSFKEPGELLSMRRVDGLKFQWHIRLFDDGEVRGHYEVSPEALPLRHLKDAYVRETDDKSFLVSLLGDYLI